MEIACAELAMLPEPTSAALPAIHLSRPTAPVVVSTARLVYFAVLGYFREHQVLPTSVVMHPLRLLTLPGSSWHYYEIEGLGAVALRPMTLVELKGVDAPIDAMICEA